MKKIFRIIGIVAVVITLVCNLQYSFFSSPSLRPDQANAAWTDVDGTMYCGSNVGDRFLKTGNWVWRNDSYYWTEMGWYGYQNGYYEFIPSNSGMQCGQWNVTANHHNTYRDVTNIIPWVNSY